MKRRRLTLFGRPVDIDDLALVAFVWTIGLALVWVIFLPASGATR